VRGVGLVAAGGASGTTSTRAVDVASHHGRSRGVAGREDRRRERLLQLLLLFPVLGSTVLEPYLCGARGRYTFGGVSRNKLVHYVQPKS
jgi:hypothetical protein